MELFDKQESVFKEVINKLGGKQLLALLVVLKLEEKQGTIFKSDTELLEYIQKIK